mmetsp:Transcript_7549/g.16219  ORF Transcript_7549/g.16219 Transcript_7549/m.16219 type:complete len:379 (+) Transcript_7549:26-1162(+)
MRALWGFFASTVSAVPAPCPLGLFPDKLLRCRPIPDYCLPDTGGTCRIFGCHASRGSTDCESGHCLCADGNCAQDGVCVPEQTFCEKQTGRRCPFGPCDNFLGASCENAICVCPADSCADSSGVCRRPGDGAVWTAYLSVPDGHARSRTDGTCRLDPCDPSRGPTICTENNYCICQPGYSADARGLCHPYFVQGQCDRQPSGECPCAEGAECIDGQCFCPEGSCADSTGRCVSAHVDRYTVTADEVDTTPLQEVNQPSTTTTTTTTTTAASPVTETSTSTCVGSCGEGTTSGDGTSSEDASVPEATTAAVASTPAATTTGAGTPAVGEVEADDIDPPVSIMSTTGSSWGGPPRDSYGSSCTQLGMSTVAFLVGFRFLC